MVYKKDKEDFIINIIACVIIFSCLISAAIYYNHKSKEEQKEWSEEWEEHMRSDNSKFRTHMKNHPSEYNCSIIKEMINVGTFPQICSYYNITYPENRAYQSSCSSGTTNYKKYYLNNCIIKDN